MRLLPDMREKVPVPDSFHIKHATEKSGHFLWNSYFMVFSMQINCACNLSLLHMASCLLLQPQKRKPPRRMRALRYSRTVFYCRVLLFLYRSDIIISLPLALVQ
jgi:hypothetical protein